MSECVVRIEMPENCTCCPMCFTADVQGYHWCAALEQEVEEGLSRPKECPIICQLPEGHGRLVDADALIELMLERKRPLVGADSSKDRYRYIQWLADFNAIKDAKTVVPAERRPNGEGD